MTRYRKRPVEIEAIRYDGTNGYEVTGWIGHNSIEVASQKLGPVIYIDTLEGRMTASPGDWVIRGVKGEFYPCKPDIFEATYEPADGPPTTEQETR